MQAEITLRLVVAALIGMTIGLERELRDQAAGLRTHMLVSVGACLFALISVYGFQPFVVDATDPFARYDASRVASQIVVGVGFLGAGTIIRHGLSVRGLTTAASLWVVAAMGTAVGIGMYWAAGVAAAITAVSLVGLRAARTWIRRRAGLAREVLTIAVQSERALDDALDVLRELGYGVRHLKLEEGQGRIDADVELSHPPDARPETLLARLGGVPGVVEVEWDQP